MSELVQWVNLPVDPKFVTENGDSTKRFGPASFRVNFSGEDLATFRWRLEKDPGDSDFIDYSPAEQGRNGRFATMVCGAQTNNSQQEATCNDEIQLPAAGDNVYILKAKRGDEEVKSSNKLTAKRRLYYQLVTMQQVSACGVQDLVDLLWGQSDKFAVQMIEKDVAEIPLLETIERNAARGEARSKYGLIREVAREYSLGDLHPYSLPIVFVRHIAESIVKKIEFTETLPPLSLPSGTPSPLKIHLKERGRTRYLWQELVPEEDAMNGGLGNWFRGGSVELVSGESQEQPRTIERDQIICWGPDKGPLGGKSHVMIEFDSDFHRRHVGSQVRVTLDLKLVQTFLGGYCPASAHMIVMATRSNWKDLLPDDSTAVTAALIHEMGHKLGMVASGSCLSPDRPGGFYPTGKYAGCTHRGNHCETGATYQSDGYWSGEPQCVMFGDDRAPKTNFCSDCKPAVRKLDLHRSGPIGRVPCVEDVS